MFFIFSKLLLVFILPLTWIIATLIASVVVKNARLKRRFLIASITLLLIFTNPFLFNQFAKVWDIDPVPLTNTKPYSCAIILGGFSGEDSKGHGYFNSAVDRFIQGVRLYNTGKVSRILVTSGNGNLIHDNFEEADWVKTQLLDFKVPDSAILIENRSRNTLENAAFSKKVINANHLKPPYLLVTSAFHMRRSLGIFKRENIDVIPYPCNYLGEHVKISIDQLIPDSSVLGEWNYYTKEVVGTLVNYLK
jgi:uncharacterized SAM-binding protein YcdF (DUF218 family)